MKFSAPFVHAAECSAFENAVCLGKLLGCFSHHRQPVVSGRWPVWNRIANRPPTADHRPLLLIVRWGEAFASLCAATLDDKLAAFRAHAHAKAMRLGAAAVVRLKSSLRHILHLCAIHLSINVSTEKIKAIGMRGELSRFARGANRRRLSLSGERRGGWNPAALSTQHRSQAVS
jgi:hypothetical protein